MTKFALLIAVFLVVSPVFAEEPDTQERHSKELIVRRNMAAEARDLGARALFRDPAAALSAYQYATRLDPENAEGWKGLSVALTFLGDMKAARAAREKSESIQQSLDEILSRRTK